MHIGEKRSMSTEIINEININGLQNFEKYSSLNPIEIHVSDNDIISTLTKYKNYKYCFIITGLLFSWSVINDINVVFITCNGLKDSRKALINGKIYNALEINNISQIKNWDKIKKVLRWVNTIL